MLHLRFGQQSDSCRNHHRSGSAWLSVVESRRGYLGPARICDDQRVSLASALVRRSFILGGGRSMLNCKSFAGITAAIIVALPSAVLVPTDGWAQIEEIVVTTRRREENLQELPIAVTAINAEMI
ncbi:uncharacterized protein METZ01_LOCUS391599, partial [marine metagenome]